MAVPYYELPGLETLYLEDSYVLSIDEEPDRFSIKLDCVLTEADPSYQPPKPNEQYCYINLTIAFEPLRRIDWINKDFRWSVEADVDGNRDLGNIDTFEHMDDGSYELTGIHWGTVRIEAGGVTVIR